MPHDGPPHGNALALAAQTVLGSAKLLLETGTHPAFRVAQDLYRSAGFDYCGPFAAYTEDPHSVFMTLEL